MKLIILALLIGVVAGLRSMMAPAVLAWAAFLGWVPLQSSWAAFMGFSFTPYIFTALAIIEILMDKLPTTPTRKSPSPFAVRVVSGAFSGAVLGAAGGATLIGLVAGAIGAVLGTLGGYEFRTRLSKATGRDVQTALLEDGIALTGAFLIVRYVI